MINDIDTGTISPPQSLPANTVDVRGLTESELGGHVDMLLASVGEATSGASSGVASLAAVWVISQIEEACGAVTLVDPRDLTKDDFATPAVLSQMLHRQIRERVAPLVES